MKVRERKRFQTEGTLGDRLPKVDQKLLGNLEVTNTTQLTEDTAGRVGRTWKGNCVISLLLLPLPQTISLP